MVKTYIFVCFSMIEVTFIILVFISLFFKIFIFIFLIKQSTISYILIVSTPLKCKFSIAHCYSRLIFLSNQKVKKYSFCIFNEISFIFNQIKDLQVFLQNKLMNHTWIEEWEFKTLKFKSLSFKKTNNFWVFDWKKVRM